MSSGPQNAANLRVVTTPNVYGSSNAAISQHGTAGNVVEMTSEEPRLTPAVSGRVYPSAPPDRGNLSNDTTLIDNNLYQ